MSRRDGPVGLYLHIPFCRRKCPYCDFFSRVGSQEKMDEYTDLLAERIKQYSRIYPRRVDTVYFGGGTPSLIGDERLCRILDTVKASFDCKGAEVTLEVNPEKKDIDFRRLREAGFDRVSIGLQSANDDELKILGRLHSVKDAEECIASARRGGFDNISLDLMIATPGQTRESIKRSVEFCAEQGASHVSAYILKIEPGTAYYKNRESLDLPDDDGQAELYIYAAELLEKQGYRQYEISNFAREGRESRHNLKYWHDEEYLGLGPGAHSFMEGRRFYYDRSFDAFARDILTDDGEGGYEEEYIMLALRLSEGAINERFVRRFGHGIPRKYYDNAKKLAATGYVLCDDEGIRLTREGFLLSNALIARIIDG